MFIKKHPEKYAQQANQDGKNITSESPFYAAEKSASLNCSFTAS
jgi:hypothetical protein